MKFAQKKSLNQSYLKGQYSADGKVFGCYFCTDGCITFTEGMILEASFSNVIFYICKCKWVPAYHLCMQMIDLAFARQAQIIFGRDPTDGQIQCEPHLSKEMQVKIPLESQSLGFYTPSNIQLLR